MIQKYIQIIQQVSFTPKKRDSPPGQWRKELSNEGDPFLRKGVGKNLEMMEPPALTETKHISHSHIQTLPEKYSFVA